MDVDKGKWWHIPGRIGHRAGGSSCELPEGVHGVRHWWNSDFGAECASPFGGFNRDWTSLSECSSSQLGWLRRGVLGAENFLARVKHSVLLTGTSVYGFEM